MKYDNKELSRRLFEDGWNKGKLDVIQELTAPNATLFDPNVPIAGKGFESVKGYFQTLKTAFPDLSFKIEDQVAEGDKVVTFLSCTGTHEGDLLGFAPSHVRATIPSVVKQRFENGKAIESWILWDTFTFMKNAGATAMAGHEMAGSR